MQKVPKESRSGRQDHSCVGLVYGSNRQDESAPSSLVLPASFINEIEN